MSVGWKAGVFLRPLMEPANPAQDAPTCLPQRLLQGVVRLFMRLGIKSVNMDDVARELGVSKKTLYKHVRDKRDLVSQALDAMIAENAAMLQEIAHAPGNAIDRHFIVLRRIRKMTQGMHPSVHFDLEKYYPEELQKLNERRDLLIQETVGRNLQRGQEEGIYRTDIDPRLISRFMVALIDAVDRAEAATQFDRPLSELIIDTFAYHIRGIATREGWEYLEQKLASEFPKNA